MLTLIHDTETNGLPPRDTKTPKLSQMPYITQLSAVLVDDVSREEVKTLNVYISDANIIIPDEAFFRDQGITTEWLRENGIPYVDAYDQMYELVKESTRMVCHNTVFDYNMNKAAFIRNKIRKEIQEAFTNNPRYCTMATLTDVLRIPSPYGYKWPTLMECYREFVDPRGFEGAHDALADCRALMKLVWAIEDRGFQLMRHFND